MDSDLLSSISALSDSGAPPAPSNYVERPSPDMSGMESESTPSVPPPPGVTPMSQSPTALAASAARPAVAPPDPNSPHAGLRNMLQNLFLGMDAFGKSIATQGREGGVQEVEAVQNARKEVALKQAASQREQQQADVMMKHTQALTNATIAQTEINKMNAPLEYQKLVMDNQKSLYDLYVNVLHINPLFAVPIVQGQTTDAHLSAINGKANGDLVNNTVLPVHDDKPGGPGNSYGFSFDQLRKVNVPIEQAASTLATLQSQIDFAKGVLPNGEKDPAVQAAQGKLDVMKKGATVNGYDFYVFNNQVQAQLLSRVNNNQAISEFQQKQAQATKAKQDADPLFKLENDPNEMTGDKAPAAIALLQSKLKDPNLPADQAPRVQRLLVQAQKAEQNAINFNSAKARAEQAVKDGDPAAAADLLGKGLVAPSQIISARNPRFAQQAFSAAAFSYPGWNAQKAEAQYKYATNPTTQNTLSMVDAMNEKGGSIDIATAAAKALPQLDSQTLNKVFNAAATEFGSTQATNFHTAMLGLADEYSKVMGGGVSSDTGRQQALDILKAGYSKGQFDGAVSIMRQDIAARKQAMVRDNPALQAMYGKPGGGSPAAPPPAGATMQVRGSDNKMHWSDGKRDLGVVQ